MIQDSRGFIWIGTNFGLNKFDGYNFTVYKNYIDKPSSLLGNAVRTICEDNSGILWIGTIGGLNRYDRNMDQFIRYKNDPADVNSLSHNDVQSIYEDRSGVLWIGTASGLNIYNRNKDNFTQLSFYNFVNKNILSIKEDRHGQLWIGTYRDGLYKLNRDRTEVTHYQWAKEWRPYNDISLCNILSSRTVFSINETSSGQLWIGTAWGLNIYNREDDCFTNYQFDKKDWIGNLIMKILEDSSGYLWLGTQVGLYRIAKKNIANPQLNFELMKVTDNNPYNLSSNAIYALLQDHSGVLWLGTYRGGINKYSATKNKFITYRKAKNDLNSLSNSQVLCFGRSHDLNQNIIWIGTERGLNKFDHKTRSFTQYLQDPNNPYSLINDKVYSICPDTVDGRPVLWIGTVSGVHRFDIKTEKFYSRKNVGFTPGFPQAGIWRIIKDCTGTRWFGTKSGLFRYNYIGEEEIIQSYFVKDSIPGGLKSNDILALFEDNKGILWIGTDRGLNSFDPSSNVFRYFSHDPQINSSISDNEIQVIFEDFKGRFWIGTANGLNMFDRDEKKFYRYYEKDGLPSNYIRGILGDDNGNLWISTPNGISVFNPDAEIFRNYDNYDGLQSNEFEYGASFRCPKTGEMFFGGVNGFNVFHPDSIRHNKYVPPVVITDFEIHNQPVPIKGKMVDSDSTYDQSPLTKQISECENLILSHTQNYISFEFAALDYNAPEKNKYAYKMEGVDPEWIYTNASRRFATYTQLEPGDYTFLVKGSNNDGIWNEEGTSIKIIILPPWWRTNLAYAIYVLVLGTIVFGTWRLQLRRIHLKQQLKMEHFEAIKLREVDQIKSRFFANISHEFRTPLTLILGPIHSLITRIQDQTTKNELSLMQRNALRLERLINQLLDLSKLEAGGMTLQTKQENMVDLVRNYSQSFESLAKQKNIKYTFNSDCEIITACVDKDKIEKILNNLLSNAFKFTAEGGVVEVGVSREPTPQSPPRRGRTESPSWEGLGVGNEVAKYLSITISDTGIGIPEDRIDKIFDRFYQVDDTHKREHEGSGIGLALTKELVELHQGKISVQSTQGDGTTFVVKLPLRTEFLEAYPLDKSENKESTEIQTQEFYDPSPEIEMIMERPTTKLDRLIEQDKPIVLVVEDNDDMRTFICDHLKNEYQLLCAGDGNDGLHKAVENIPDLIISDVMMPKMDGYELCKKLKTDERTSHIPVILLTARAAQEDKIEGLETGADDYISKPFDTRELNVRVKNLIKQRRKLRERFRKEYLLEPGEETIISVDDKFLRKVIDIVNKKILDPQFNVERLSNDIAMNRSHMSRKIHALTNQSPNELIRSLRLKKAAYLLQKKSGNVTEIANEVGFNNPSYFSKCFHKQYGKSPGHYSS